jgi:hypothetical protein
VAGLRLFYDELKLEAVAARGETTLARMEAQRRQLELGQVVGERDRFRSQAAEAVGRAEALRGQLAEATERLAEASARAGTLAEGLAVAVGSAESAQAVASEQRARAKGTFRLLCDFDSASFFNSCLKNFFDCLQSSRRLSTSSSRRLPRRLSRRKPTAWQCPRLSRPFAGPLTSTTSPRVAPPKVTCGPWVAMCAADSVGCCITALGGPSPCSLPTMT